MSVPERWLLTVDDTEHLVSIEDTGLGRRLSWSVDGVEVADKKTTDERVVLAHDEHGAVFVKLPTLAGPARRVSWWPAGDDAEAKAHTALGGTDFDPEPGSKAAEREAWIREHPRRHAVRRGLTAAAGVVVPLLLLWLLARISWPQIPWPDWHIPWPQIPWPDWHIPWPQIPWPDWSLPGWIEPLMESLKYVIPVLIAVAAAQGEVRRRRRQDLAKQATAPTTSPSQAATAQGTVPDEREPEGPGRQPDD